MAFISGIWAQALSKLVYSVGLSADQLLSWAGTHASLGAVSASTLGNSEENGLPHTSARTQLPQSMKIMHEIMYKLEVLYVLCVLLMGRQRNQVGASPASGIVGGW